MESILAAASRPPFRQAPHHGRSTAAFDGGGCPPPHRQQTGDVAAAGRSAGVKRAKRSEPRATLTDRATRPGSDVRPPRSRAPREPSGRGCRGAADTLPGRRDLSRKTACRRLCASTLTGCGPTSSSARPSSKSSRTAASISTGPAAACMIAGPNTQIVTATIARAANLVGVRFRPGVAARWLGVSAAELLNTHPPLEDLWGRSARRRSFPTRSRMPKMRMRRRRFSSAR